MQWHNLDIDAILQMTGSAGSGLSCQVAEERLIQYGYNELEEKKRKPAWLLLLSQFKDVMIIILVVAAVISGIIGEQADTIIILAIVVLNAIVGFVQEYRAEKAMEALKKMAALQAKVLRDGQLQVILSSELVPGDIVYLEAGNTVPADLRLFDVKALRVVEASLTGESMPVDKRSEVIVEEDLPLGDRFNMAFKGTQVTNGRAMGVVVATGMQTQIGEIAKMLQEKESSTPLQQRMADFGKKISYLVLLICIVLFGVGILRGEEPMEMLLVAISLAVAAIPEALPALITIALAQGAKRMVKKHVLIRKLHAVETLGSVTFICTDKTGTLTQNKMKLVTVQPAETEKLSGDGLTMLELAMTLNHDVSLQKKHKLIGDPTEVAVVEWFRRRYSSSLAADLQERYPRVAELPFDSDRKCMTTIHQYDNGYLAIVKGAAEAILERLGEGVESFSIHCRSNELASGGQRVLAYGYRLLERIPEPFSYGEVETELSFAGLVGMIDPPREGIDKAIAECKSAGIRPVMITGDHKETATAIARQIGLVTGDELVVTGNELNRMSDEVFDAQVELIRVYARVAPDQKLRIVKTLQQRQHFVAMTGDGVNDAPSLKRANIGVAMGITGTDVSKEASHMILLDDNFASIVKAVKEGRRIYDNIRKFVKYILTCNSAEIWIIFLAPFFNLPIPLLPVHILWINLVTDGLPGLALTTERSERNIMQRPPRSAGESLFAEGIGFHIVWVGLLMTFVTLATQAWSFTIGMAHWQTMVFSVLVLAQLAHVFAIRSDTEFIYKKGLFSNPLLAGAVLFTFLLQLVVIYLPAANRIFKTAPLSVTELLLCIGIAAIVFHAVELEKWIKVKRKGARRYEE